MFTNEFDEIERREGLPNTRGQSTKKPFFTNPKGDIVNNEILSSQAKTLSDSSHSNVGFSKGFIVKSSQRPSANATRNLVILLISASHYKRECDGGASKEKLSVSSSDR